MHIALALRCVFGWDLDVEIWNYIVKGDAAQWQHSLHLQCAMFNLSALFQGFHCPCKSHQQACTLVFLCLCHGQLQHFQLLVHSGLYGIWCVLVMMQEGWHERGWGERVEKMSYRMSAERSEFLPQYPPMFALWRFACTVLFENPPVSVLCPNEPVWYQSVWWALLWPFQCTHQIWVIFIFDLHEKMWVWVMVSVTVRQSSGLACQPCKARKELFLLVRDKYFTNYCCDSKLFLTLSICILKVTMASDHWSWKLYFSALSSRVQTLYHFFIHGLD